MGGQIILAVVYIFIYMSITPMIISITTGISRFIASEIRRSMRRRSRQEVEKKRSLSSKLNEALSFELRKDKRTFAKIPIRFLILFIFMGGLILGTIFVFVNISISIILLLLSVLSNILSFIFYSPILKARETKMERMVSFKRDNMGLVSKGRDMNINNELTVLEWDDDYSSPTKIQMSIPTNFDELRTKNFADGFSSFFGKGRAWVPDRSNPDTPGWDFYNATVTLVLSPPLPRRATWVEDYVLSDQISWSFFPIALGSENGVSFNNPKTGELEHVLGFDLAGEQAKLSSKLGAEIGEEVVLAPQVLIAGGTGGGKALKNNTIIKVIEEASSDND